ncbi:hypothetical protein D3C75_1152000 [compost metagenome]
MAHTLHVVLTATELDDANFVVTTLGDHFSNNFGTSNDWSADVHVVAIGNQQNAVESHGFASGDFQFFDFQVFTFGDFVLLATGNNYCVHGYFSDNPAHPALYRKSIGWHGCIGLERPSAIA